MDPRRPFQIIGTGVELPDDEVDNPALIERFGLATTPAWIEQKTGIARRRLAAPGLLSSDLAAAAGSKALAAAGLGPLDVDLLIVASVTPDFLLPSLAAVVQAKIGCRRAPALDVPTGCPGFIVGLDIATRYIDDYPVILVIGADTASRLAAASDRTLKPIFGDGAGAVLIQRSKGNHGVLAAEMHTAGDSGTLVIPSGGYSDRTGTQLGLVMDGPAVFSFAVEAFVSLIRGLSTRTGISPRELQAVVPHQANARILEAAGLELGLDERKIVSNIRHLGNTANASVPIALHQAIADRMVTAGGTAALVAFGSGLSWAGMAIRL